MSGKKWWLSVVAALALVLSAAPLPASAGPDGRGCWERLQPTRPLVECVDLQLAIRFPDLGCPPCGLAFLWRHDPAIREEAGNRVNELVIGGLRLLGNAAKATDPAVRNGYRAQAMETFANAARAGGGARTSLRSVGAGNPVQGSFTPRADLTWAVAAGADLADGIALMKQSFGGAYGGSPVLRARAEARFEEAYTELSQQRIIPG